MKITGCLRAGPTPRCWFHRSQGVCVLLALIFQLASLEARAGDALDRVITLDIPPETRLDDALIEWGTKVGVALMVNTPTVAHQTTQGVRGTLRARDALLLLLRDTGLSYRAEDGRVLVVPTTTFVRSAQRTEDTRLESRSGSELQTTPPSANDTRSGPLTAVALTSDNTRRTDLDVVVVTAQKRTERLQDVPVPVSVISAPTLVDNNQLRLQDYFSTVPGFSVSPIGSGFGAQTLAIRGITTGFDTTPTVGVVVDEVPFGSSGNVFGSIVPDFDPGDLARIEVLRGPQGALYGASSMGGLIKFVTVDPATDAVSGSVQAGTSTVHNGAEMGYSFRGSVNVPLSDTFAVRASGFTHQDPGYIDNPVLHVDGINEVQAYGGHLTALWRPSELLSLKFGALYQDYKGYGSNDVDVQPGLGDLQQNYLPGLGRYERKTQAYSLVATAKLGSVNLTAISGYNVNNVSNAIDFTYAFGPLTQSLFGVSGTPLLSTGHVEKLTQEVRASIPIGQTLEWLVGAFYTHENAPGKQTVLAENPATGSPVGYVLTTLSPGGLMYVEYAAFTDLTFHISDRFDVQIGGRESEIRETDFQSTNSGALFGNQVIGGGQLKSTANAFTYLFTPSFKVSSDLMVYARLASGYRAGGPNAFNPPGPRFDPNEPAVYKPDKTQNYEIGVKGELLDHRFSFDGSLYHISWKDIQVTLASTVNGADYTTNGSRAKSDGVEISIESRPLTGLRIGAWIAWDKAVLTESMPSNSTAYGIAGDRLPYSSRFSGNLTLDQEFPLARNITGYVGSTLSYVGDREGTFIDSPQRAYYPSYARTDVRAGVRYDAWTGNLYINNITDKRALLGGGPGASPPFGFIYIQPRTIGLSLTRTF